ncbi:1-deoxy-D-xylulose-5-phosphate synthase [Actinokineospora sp. UTMC 2448]|nr:1-deoxy-D-xylulose-5-phosphate synthase [Actinokineospora sp. UTMC 2448]
MFGDALLDLGARRPDIVCLTAAMQRATGLTAFAEAYPDRVLDVGIAEPHAVACAAGLAMGGMHPVVAMHATFLSRAFDQVLLDVALHGLPVTLVLDRAGVTGGDGPSHHGMWDLSLLQAVPGLRIAAPRDARRLRALLADAVAADGPTVLRFPDGATGPDVPAVRERDGLAVLHESTARDVLLVSVGSMAVTAVRAALKLADQGVGVTVCDPGWVSPPNPALVALADSHRLVVSVEDNTRVGGVGVRLAQAVADAGVTTPAHALGLPAAFLPPGPRPEVLRGHRLDASGIARTVLGLLGAGARPPVPPPRRVQPARRR